MTLKEFLTTVTGIKSIGIYYNDGSVIDTDLTAITIIPYLNYKISKVDLFTIDEGKPQESHWTSIRATIKLYTEDR
jgi:predicted SnoaL-like aldol condensation-catalyzing enzyme